MVISENLSLILTFKISRSSTWNIFDFVSNPSACIKKMAAKKTKQTVVGFVFRKVVDFMH